MTIKKVLISIGIVVAAIVITIGAIFLIRSMMTPKTTGDIRGVKLTADYQFKSFDSVVAAAKFTTLPTDGWTRSAASVDDAQGSATLNGAGSCSLSAMSQLTPYIDKKSAEAVLSQNYATTITQSEQGTLRDEYVLKIGSDKGDVELYTALYTPKVILTHASGTTPTMQDGTTKLTDEYTTLIAVRVLKNPITPIGATVAKDSKTIGYGDSVPTVTLKYSCKAADFKIDSAVKTMQSIKLNLSAPAETTSPTSGK